MTRPTGCVEACLQQEPPFCTAACPFGLDILDFTEKLKRGAFQAAYKVYQNTVGFPAIVAALCPEPCAGACPRRSRGGAVNLRLLEQAAIDHARSLEPNSYNVPPKGKRVAVVGAGVSGLACTLRMASRGYEVALFERAGRIGGHLHDLLAPEAFLPEFERMFMHETYDLRLGAEVRGLDQLAGFDAVYVATGAGGEDFGLAADPGGAFASTRPGVFLGGALAGRDTLGAMADGLRASHALERYLKAGTMNQPAVPGGTRLRLDPGRFPEAAAVVPAQGGRYGKEEAVAEAGRCLRCTCDACSRACDLMTYFRKLPKRISEEVFLSVNPGTLDGNGTMCTRLMSTCNQCGRCREVCPQDIDTGRILLEGHRAMHRQGKMPWAWHDFFLRDLASANGEGGLVRQPPGWDRSRYLFFPGCQLGASDPRYVAESYRFLRAHWPDTALALGCCGAPAEWAGDEALREEVGGRLREAWAAMGRPTAVFACPTCKLTFARYLPELEGVFLYQLLLEQGAVPAASGRGPASVFDPCASREEPDLQRTVRDLAAAAGCALEPLPAEGRMAQCCSWGGQVAVAHPAYARYVVQQRITAGPRPYITYCSNCRDVFAAAGKPAWHILDLAFGLNGPDRLPPTVTERRRNRIRLKHQLLREYWGEAGEPEEAPMDLAIAPELKRKLDQDRLLETDLAAVVEHCERTGQKLVDPATGSFTGHLLVGHSTCWVEYRPRSGGGFELLNAYAHRMSLDGE
jgi:Fe-S oxidoreductase